MRVCLRPAASDRRGGEPGRPLLHSFKRHPAGQNDYRERAGGATTPARGNVAPKPPSHRRESQRPQARQCLRSSHHLGKAAYHPDSGRLNDIHDRADVGGLRELDQKHGHSHQSDRIPENSGIAMRPMRAATPIKPIAAAIFLLGTAAPVRFNRRYSCRKSCPVAPINQVTDPTVMPAG